MRRYRPLPAVLFAILVSALVGGLFGRSALATDDKVPEHYRAFTAALNAIETSYIDKVDSDNLVYGAVRGMLGTLDPHSSFFSPKEYAQMRERQEGRYYGIGVSIQAIDGDITAMQVFEQSPAYKKGIRRGDVLANVEGEDTKGWTVDQAMRKLRGPKGTEVGVGVRRRGYPEMIKFALMRDEVYIPTVPAYFMIDDTTGYIRMQDFGENTDRDVKHALHDLSSKGMKRLLFDIRGNPGGPLDQAIKVSNEFLPKGKMIVYTRGRVPNSDQDYRATEESEFTDMPIVALVNRNSASAAEIVVGRAAGSRSRVSGRRDDVRQGAGAVGLPHQRRRRARADDGALLHAVGTHHPAAMGRELRRVSQLHAARSGREQAAQPERPEAHRLGPSGLRRRRHRARQARRRTARRLQPRARSAACSWRAASSPTTRRSTPPRATRAITQASTNRKLVKRNFVVDEAMVADFREQMKSDKLKIDEDAFAKDAEFIKAMIRFEIDNAVFGIADARRHLIGVDPQAQAALTMFGEAQKLTELSKGSKIKAH